MVRIEVQPGGDGCVLGWDFAGPERRGKWPSWKDIWKGVGGGQCSVTRSLWDRADPIAAHRGVRF